nr:MAG TPA: hypothetical protein [Caudoviricetes sp.]
MISDGMPKSVMAMTKTGIQKARSRSTRAMKLSSLLRITSKSWMPLVRHRRPTMALFASGVALPTN